MRQREISEYKVISSLDIVKIPDDRMHWNWWVGKFKGALVQTRGPIWKGILDAIDAQSVTEDFEELTTTSEQWDDWFRSQYADADLNRFKVDVYLVLLDKVGVSMASVLKKYGTNGIRCYKALQKYSTDLSELAKTGQTLAHHEPERSQNR